MSQSAQSAGLFDASRDEEFMQIAIRHAMRGLGRTAPNPSVGAVLVAPGPDAEILSIARTADNGRPHAERQALAHAGDRARNACCYVTLEPCSHHGKTSPCAEALIEAGVSRVVIALKDSDPRVAGRGIAMLRDAGLEVVTGILASEAQALHIGHVTRVTKKRPHIQLKLAISADGFIGRAGAGQVAITGDQSRKLVHSMRARADAILVGIGTVLADDPDLTCRLPGLEAQSPIRIVLDRSARLPLESKLVETVLQVPVWVCVGPEAPQTRVEALEDAGVRVIRCPGRGFSLDLSTLTTILADEEITLLFIEGGSKVARSFIEGGLVDEFCIFTGPDRIGAGGLAPLDGLSLSNVLREGQVARDHDFGLVEDYLIGADRFRRYKKGDKAMFTGIVTDRGEITAIDRKPSGARISIASRYDASHVDLGASVACAGICLTVVDSEHMGDGRSVFHFDVSSETLDRTTLGQWTVGDFVNLERPLTLGTELGGHVVTGHVDGLGTIIEREDLDDTSRFVLQTSRDLAKFIAEKGSVTLDGTSLTVNDVDGLTFSIMLIPHTLAVTSWGTRKAGDTVNLEVDLMARYAARLAEFA